MLGGRGGATDMAQIPFVGPSYNLDSRPASVQRTINIVPYPQEPGNERTKWVFKDVPGLVETGVTLASPTIAISGETKAAADDETFTATVTRFGATSGTSTATWTATGDTYDGVSGFQGPGGVFTGTVSFSPGETTQTIQFNLKIGVGTTFTLTVTLTSPVNATISIDAADLDATAGAPPATDPYYSGVVLLLHPDAPSSIVDHSQYTHTLNSSLVSVTATNPPPSNSVSILNSSIGSGLLEAASSTVFERAAQEPFTIEFSVRVDTSLASPDNSFFMAWDDGRYHLATPLGSNLYRISYVDGSGQNYGDLTGGVWYQLAASYDGTTMRLFTNGTLVSSGLNATAALSGSRKYGVISVPERADLKRLIGTIAEVRLTIGVARYTADYTPDVTSFPNS